MHKIRWGSDFVKKRDILWTLQFDEEGQVVQTKVDELIESMIESTEAQADIKEKAVACATNTTEVFAG